MEFNIELYKRALHFAAEAHNGQLTPNGYPYILHVTSVAVEVIGSYLNNNTHTYSEDRIYGDINVAACCALLHDTIEDTNVTYSELCATFGTTIADGVLALTKNKDLDKELQMDDSLHRLSLLAPEIQSVKLADRITNLSSIPTKWNQEKINKYLNESMSILNKLGDSNKYLSKRLANKIESIMLES